MGDYDLRVSDAKRYATQCVCRLSDPKSADAATNMAAALDDLNVAWDALTDCLVRQRDELGKQVLRLIHELAEAKRPRRPEGGYE